jgi:hypothetical protein
MEGLTYSRSISKEEIPLIFQEFKNIDRPMILLKEIGTEVYGTTYPPIKDCLEKDQPINFILLLGLVENEVKLKIYGQNLKEESLPEKIYNFIKKYFKK